MLSFIATSRDVGLSRSVVNRVNTPCSFQHDGHIYFSVLRMASIMKLAMCKLNTKLFAARQIKTGKLVPSTIYTVCKFVAALTWMFANKFKWLASCSCN